MDLAVERLRSLCVADVMSRNVIPVPADYTLAQTAAHFVEHEISWAPVVDAKGLCIGVLSGTDFLRYESHPPMQQGGSSPAAEMPRARDCMSSAIQSIAPYAGILQAARIMCAQHLHRLLVLDKAGRPLGVISSMDIAAALVNVMDEMESNEIPDANSI